MKVLIIGYGSIGKRHEDVLLTFKEIEIIDIVTKQKLDKKRVFHSIVDIKNLDFYDYFIIASPTNRHYYELTYLDLQVKGKIIFCEKPLFSTAEKIEIKNNEIFIGYVLRFHPLLQELKRITSLDQVISVNVNCGQYLPTWRPNSDYTKSYSAKKDQGGGVLLDLSHEIDYVQWLFGYLDDIKSYQVKISNLNIDSDDLTMFIGKTDNNVMVNVSIDYISKITYRRVLVHTMHNSYELDLIRNILIQADKDGIEKKYFAKTLERNYMFEQMHKSIFNDRKNICTYEEALKVMDTISIIQEQNR